MTRRESLLFLFIAFVAMCAGAIWLFGPWGLMVCGAALGTFTMMANDVSAEELKRAEYVSDPPRTASRFGKRNIKV